MWELEEVGGVKMCTHSKGKTGFVLLIVGLLALSFVWAVHLKGEVFNIRDKRGNLILQSDTSVGIASIPGVILLGLGFLLTGVETKLTLNPMKNVLIYDYSYGFGSSHKEFPLEDVQGLQFIRIYVTLVARSGGAMGAMGGMGGERKVGSRIDGSLNLVTRSEGPIPLITVGDGDLTSQGARILRDYLELELHEATEQKKEYVARNRHHH